MDWRFVSRSQNIDAHFNETINSLGFIRNVSHSNPHFIKFMVFIHFVDVAEINSELSYQIIAANKIMIEKWYLYHSCF